ncbi:DUF4405 domain-containing protein [Nitratifractor sp.]
MKKIVSLTLGLSFLVMSYTGIILFICPHGRVAYWSDWHFLGLDKWQYGDLHTTSMVIFLLFGVWHIYYNWRPLVSYLRDKAHRIRFTKKEFLVALAINAVVVVGTLTHLPPFKQYLEWGESIKDSWSKTLGEPPYGHAEENTLKVLCQREGIDYAQAVKLLHAKGFRFEESQSIMEIAKNNGVTPQKIYEAILPAKSRIQNGDQPPSGLGRKRIGELRAYGIDPDKALEYLHRKGAKEAGADTVLRDLASELGMTPYEIFEALKKLK